MYVLLWLISFKRNVGILYGELIAKNRKVYFFKADLCFIRVRYSEDFNDSAGQRMKSVGFVYAFQCGSIIPAQEILLH